MKLTHRLIRSYAFYTLGFLLFIYVTTASSRHEMLHNSSFDKGWEKRKAPFSLYYENDS